MARLRRPPAVKVSCPRCGKPVASVDGEYARHYVKSQLCAGSRREIKQPVQL